MPRAPLSPRASAARRLRRSAGALSTSAVAGMEEQLPWFSELSAQDRSWVGLIVQAGVQNFIEWYAAGGPALATRDGGTELAASVFGAAPRALAGVITLQQTVDLVRLTIDVVEASVDDVLEGADADAVHAAILRYAREVAFATAEVYARAAEARGAWDARLEALVVDAVLRSETDEALLSRASALGWRAREDRDDVVVVIGRVPDQRAEEDVFEQARHLARGEDLDALCAVQGDRLVLLLGGVRDPRAAAAGLLEVFDGDAPVVVGPLVADLASAQHSARAAQSAYRTCHGWPDAPRPVLADELLPERALGGDGHARRHLVEEVYAPLVASGEAVETLRAYLEGTHSIESAARSLFVHANTVRYRLRRITELTGLDPTTARGGFTLQIALVLGRLASRRTPVPPES